MKGRERGEKEEDGQSEWERGTERDTQKKRESVND